MSPSDEGRKFPHPRRDLASEIAAALRRDFGDHPSTVKRIAQLAGARERTVKNWLAGNNGPSGDMLVALIRHSDQVLEVVLRRSERHEILRSAIVGEALGKMQASLRSMEQILGGADD